MAINNTMTVIKDIRQNFSDEFSGKITAEPQRSYMWEMRILEQTPEIARTLGDIATQESSKSILENMFSSIPKIDAKTAVGLTSDIIGDVAQKQTEKLLSNFNAPDESPSFYVRSLTLPSMANSPIEKHFMGTKMNFTGHQAEVPQCNIGFWDSEKLDVYRFIHTWLNQTLVNFNGRAHPERALRKTVQLILKSTTDLEETAVFTFLDCIPSSIGELKFDYDMTGVMMPSFTFQYRKVVFDPKGRGLAGYAKTGGLDILNDYAKGYLD